jgi:hypothetical protein
MKLRNKKTGEEIILIDHTFDNYNSLAEVMKEWEDYKPSEPLIKDKNHPERAEKAQKTLKMWADANGFKRVSYRADSYVSVFYNEFNPVECATTIEFGWIMEGLKQGIYDITELCGEEEDYKPSEPLIKDEKIRKAVRAWAEASSIDTTEIKVSKGIVYTAIIGWKDCRRLSMDFESYMLEKLEDGKTYTITELCGEEEE